MSPNSQASWWSSTDPLFIARIVGDASLTLGMLGGSLLIELLGHPDESDRALAREKLVTHHRDEEHAGSDDEDEISLPPSAQHAQDRRLRFSRVLPCDSVVPYRRSVARFSDALACLAIATPLLLVSYEARRRGNVPAGPATDGAAATHLSPAGTLLVDATVVTQSVCAALLAAQVAKHVVFRERPYSVHASRRFVVANGSKDHHLRNGVGKRRLGKGWEGYLGGDFDATRSFFSGHVAISFAAAAAGLAALASRRHFDPIAPMGDGDDDASSAFGVGLESWYGACATLGLASCVGGARIISGMHFVSDVVVGAVVGTAFACAVSWLH